MMGMLGAQAIAASTDGNHMPADKTAVAGSVRQDMGPGQTKTILQETMRVSSVSDLILGVSLECSILTRLVTENQDRDTSDGKVTISVWIDNAQVPVATEDPDGSVVFCDRTYSRQVTDQEIENGLVDKEDDYIRTRTANAFNWVAFNVGRAPYDAGDDNVIFVEVRATYEATATDDASCTAAADTCSTAHVGKRTLVIEPVKASNTETSSETDPAPEEQQDFLPL